METEKNEFFCYEDTSGWPVYDLEEYKAGKRDPVQEIGIGSEVAVQTFFGYASATVIEKFPDGDYVAENEDSLFPISFNEEKGYWVCSMGMHKKSIEVVDKTCNSGITTKAVKVVKNYSKKEGS